MCTAYVCCISNVFEDSGFQLCRWPLVALPMASGSFADGLWQRCRWPLVKLIRFICQQQIYEKETNYPSSKANKGTFSYKFFVLCKKSINLYHRQRFIALAVCLDKIRFHLIFDFSISSCQQKVDSIIEKRETARFTTSRSMFLIGISL